MRGNRRWVEAFLRDELLESLPSSLDRRALAAARSATYVIHQDVSYEYTQPITELRQRLVVLPKARHLDQLRLAHRFDVQCAAGTSHLRRRTDRFRNSLVHVHLPAVDDRVDFSVRAVLRRSSQATGPASSVDDFSVTAPTRLTESDDAIRDAAASVGRSGDVATSIDAMAELVHDSIEYAHDVTSVRTTAAEAWHLGQGVCQDMAHVMLAMCSTLGIAARYVSGHLVGDGASHAWIECFDPARGTVIAIDPTHNRRTDLRYVTTATGRDYLDVAPTSGTYRSSGGRGTLTVRKSIRVAELD